MERGYVALTFDYRGFGESEGAKRRLIPAEQVHDIHAATTFLSAQDVVDPARLAICGVSFGGGNAVMAAANDDRLRCVISVNGVADGEDWLRSLRPYWEWRALLRRIEADRVRRAVTGQSEWVDLYEIMVPDPATREAHRKTFAVAPERHHDLPLETAEAVIAHRPILVAHRVAPRPALWIHVEGDCLVPMEQSIRMYERAGEPKKLVLLPGGLRHHDVYQGAGFAEAGRLALGWLEQHVPVRSASG